MRDIRHDPPEHLVVRVDRDLVRIELVCLKFISEPREVLHREVAPHEDRHLQRRLQKVDAVGSELLELCLRDAHREVGGASGDLRRSLNGDRGDVLLEVQSLVTRRTGSELFMTVDEDPRIRSVPHQSPVERKVSDVGAVFERHSKTPRLARMSRASPSGGTAYWSVPVMKSDTWRSEYGVTSGRATGVPEG